MYNENGYIQGLGVNHKVSGLAHPKGVMLVVCLIGASWEWSMQRLPEIAAVSLRGAPVSRAAAGVSGVSSLHLSVIPGRNTYDYGA